MGRLSLAFAAAALVALPFAAHADPEPVVGIEGVPGCVAYRLENTCVYEARGTGYYTAAFQGVWHIWVMRDGVQVINIAGELLASNYLDTMPGDLVFVEAKPPPQCNPEELASPDPECQEIGYVHASDRLTPIGDIIRDF